MSRGGGGFLTRNRVRIASGAVVAAAAASLVAYALSAQGFEVHHAALNDGGVWVTNDTTGQFGRLNKPISQLDGAVYSAGGQQASFDIDVLQDGAAVVARDAAKGQLYPIDVAGLKAAPDNGVEASADAPVAMAGGVLAVVDPGKGVLRAVTYDPEQSLPSLAGLDSAKPLAAAGSAAALTVAQDGTIFTASADRGLTTIAVRAGRFTPPRRRPLAGVAGRLTISAVGDQPVVLASPNGSDDATLILPNGRSLRLPGGGSAVLQQPGPAADDVLVATSKALISVALGTAKATTLTQDGTGEDPAAPIRLRGCLFAAWAGTPGRYAGQCAGSKLVSSPLDNAPGPLTFRINRGQQLLNDRGNGNTWNGDSGHPRQVADWKAVTPPPKRNSHQNNDNHLNTDQNRALPPKPADDEFGARPGRTTSLYVLDNDSDPSGEILAVDSVSASGAVARELSVSPDGQTVDIALPAGATGDTTFKYVVRAAKGGTATATVTVHARTPDQNAAPTLRRGWKARSWTVPQSGTVTIPVLTDWRDYVDGDAVVLSSAKASAGQVATTPDGALIYTAPADAGPQTISYGVRDTMGATASGQVKVTVQPADGKAVAAEAQTDYARGDVGTPITVAPLANDLPGSDPLHPTATLQLAGDVASPSGTSVRTDVASGDVVVTAKHPGTFTLGYQVAYGNAPLGKSTIRVDVAPARGAQPPVTAPDVAVLHGQSPVTVDVLANDADPAGDLLAVERAVPSDATQLQVAVVGGRFLRIAALAAHLVPASQTIEYTVSDGLTGTVTGEVTVTQLPDPEVDTPIALADYATVRAGDSVAIPVLDNDSTPAGDPVSLVRNVPTAPGPGRFTVTPALGTAYVSGAFVRYVAPARVVRTTDVTIDYFVQNEAGDQQQVGHAQVTITPAPSKLNPDQPPVPRSLEIRTVAGDTVTIKVPTSGVDPDGDSVVVTGIGSAPTLGRVLGFGASSITYQAYPAAGNGGTDTLQYVVSDTFGLTATGVVRIAVVPPGDPQPPVAVNDSVTVAPNAVVTVDALANDLVAPDDRVSIVDLARTNRRLPAGAKLLSPRGPIQLRAGADVRHPVTLTYAIDDGLTTSRAMVTVRAQNGINLPPVAFDQYAHAKPSATTVTVDLLHGDYDPDSTAPLTVVSPGTGAVGGRVTLPLKPMPSVVPYVVKDAAGATAMAVVYVPAARAGAPYAKPGAEVKVPFGGSTTISVADYVIDPAGKALRTTTSDTISASPLSKLTAKAGGSATQLVITAAKGYAGPAAVTFQVTDGRTLTERGAQQAYVTVPVQVGDVTPVLRCPATVITIMAGAPTLRIPVATLCHVWTPQAATAAALPYTGSWKRQPGGVTLGGQDTPVLTLTADGSAKPGDTGILVVGVKGAKAPAQTLAIRIVKARKLIVTPPVVLDGVKAGDAKTVDLRDHVDSPFGLQAPVEVVGVPGQSAGMPATVSASGSQVTVRPGKDSHGTIRFSFVVTDVRDTTRTDRQVAGEITVHVLGHPDAPTNVAASRTVKSNEVDLTWTAPANNGAPIDHYTVKYGAGTQTCSAAPACAIRSPNLRNGHQYSFNVIAHNAVGDSPPSTNQAVATPDAVPSAVPSLTASNPQNGQLTLSWTPPTGDFSPVLHYDLSWLGGSKRVAAGLRSTVVSGLDNDRTYDFTIVAWNKKGASPEAHNGSPIRQSAGKPTTPPAPTVTVADDTASNSRVVTLAWGDPAVDPQGPKPLYYTVVRSPAWSGTNPCANIPATTCRDTSITLDGTTYTYAVQARNSAGTDAAHTSALGPASRMEAAATPDPITISSLTPTGNDGQAQVQFDAPKSHGKTSTVTCTMSPGGACGEWTFPTSGQAGVTETLNGLTNGTATSVTLRECNGASGNDFSGTACVTSDPKSVTTYGPMRNLAISTSVSGTRVNWSVSVDPNGKPANVHISNNHGWAQDYTTGTSGWQTSGGDDVGYNTNDTISVTVSDAGRNTLTGSDGKTTGPPPVSVTVAWGGGAPSGNCGGDATCTYMNVSVANMSAGKHTVHWMDDIPGDGEWYTDTITVGSNGGGTNIDQHWVGYGNQTYHFWVVIDGVESNHLSSYHHTN